MSDRLWVKTGDQVHSSEMNCRAGTITWIIKGDTTISFQIENLQDIHP